MKLKKRFIKILLVQSISLLGFRINRIPSKKRLNEELLRQEWESKEKRKQELIKNNIWLINLKIKTVLDIGSNTGQFAEKILTILKGIDLYCFEPITSCYEELKRNLGSNKRVKFFNFALGNENGDQTINLNEYSPSSSILEMNKIHKEAFTYTEKTYTEKIEIKKLDDILGDLILTKPLLIKIDVQGFEMEVLKGGFGTINQADIIIIETTFEELYKSQPLFHEIYTFLKGLGFTFKGNFEQLINPNDGRILQADSIFMKI